MIINTHKVLSFTQAKIDGLYFGCLGLTDIYCGCRKPPRHQKNVLDFNQWQKQIKLKVTEIKSLVLWVFSSV